MITKWLVMMFTLTVIAPSTPTFADEKSASGVSPQERIENILSCRENAEPEELISLIKTLGGLPIVQNTNNSMEKPDANYTLPNSVDVFGRPVRLISIQQNENSDGAFIEYGSVFSEESASTVARYAEIPLANGQYRKEIGGNDLSLKSEAGITYILCANDVRTVVKSLKHNAKVMAANIKNVLNF